MIIGTGKAGGSFSLAFEDFREKLTILSLAARVVVVVVGDVVFSGDQVAHTSGL